MLCFSSKKNERDSKITSIAEDHDLQNQMHSHHSKISSQMTSSLLEMHKTYENNKGMAKHDGQSPKSATQFHFLQKFLKARKIVLYLNI